MSEDGFFFMKKFAVRVIAFTFFNRFSILY